MQNSTVAWPFKILHTLRLYLSLEYEFPECCNPKYLHKSLAVKTTFVTYKDKPILY